NGAVMRQESSIAGDKSIPRPCPRPRVCHAAPGPGSLPCCARPGEASTDGFQRGTSVGTRLAGAENHMHRSVLVLGFLAATVSITLLEAHEARACGGCFHPPAQTATDITDER